MNYGEGYQQHQHGPGRKEAHADGMLEGSRQASRRTGQGHRLFAGLLARTLHQFRLRQFAGHFEEQGRRRTDHQDAGRTRRLARRAQDAGAQGGITPSNR